MDRTTYERIYANEAVPDESLKFEHNPGQALILSMVRASDPGSREKEGIGNIRMSVIIGGFMHFFAISIQVILMILIFVYPIEASEDPWETHLAKLEDALRSALRSIPPRLLMDQDRNEYTARRLCENDHTIMFSQSLLIFVWATKMLPYLAKTAWCLHVTTKLPRAADGKPLCYEADKNAFIITHMRRGVRMTIVATVLVPQLLVDAMILWCGAKFLFFCTSLETLITKSISFFFLTQLDEVIYEGLGSRNFKDQISKSFLKWKRETRNHQWDLWVSSLCKFVFALSVTLYYTRVYHGDIQRFRELCYEYKAVHFPGCDGCGMTLLGKHFMPL